MTSAQPGTQQPLHTVVQKLIGCWKEESDEHFDDFMKALDVNAIKRAVGDHTKMKEDWSVAGQEICVKVHCPFKSTTTKFRLNELIDEDTMDGKKSKSIYTEENGRLMCRQQREPHNVIQCREIGPDGKMLLTMTLEAPTPVVSRIRFCRNDS